jgi:hypothetical protein
MSTGILKPLNGIRDPRILSGPETVIAADKLRLLETNKALWPYDWVFPSKNAIRVTGSDSGIKAIVAPPNGVATTVVQYTVPTGFRFIMTGILRWFQGTGFVMGSGNALWSMDINLGSYIAQGLSKTPITMGSPQQEFQFGFPCSAPEVFKSLEVLRDQVITTADIVPGAPNYFIGGFFGWLEPAEG